MSVEDNAPDVIGYGIEALTALMIAAFVFFFISFAERYVAPVVTTYLRRPQTLCGRLRLSVKAKPHVAAALVRGFSCLQPFWEAIFWMKRTAFRAILLGAAFIFMMHSVAQAHVVCGDRVFPTTLTMDDPGVSDEVSLPTIALTPTPSAQSNSYGYEWDKTITEDLGFAVNGDYLTQRSPTQKSSGWDNITVTLKDQHPCITRYKHEELTWSVGVVRLIPGTGSAQLRNGGAIESVGSTAPTFYFGKGLGDLPAAYLRPFAVTAEVSRVFSDTPSVSPSAWTYAASLQYSLPYLQQNVKALHAPQFLMRMTPIVEIAMTSPDSGSPTGTIAPGILYDSNTWQLGAEVVIPASRATRQVQGTGFIIQFHEFLDTYYKSWFGRPLINRNLWE